MLVIREAFCAKNHDKLVMTPYIIKIISGSVTKVKQLADA